MRQGRSTVRGRRGRYGEERGESMEGTSGEEGRKGKQVENGVDEVLEVESPSTVGDANQDDAGRMSPAARERRAALLAAQFKIDDVGSISQSWGE